MGSSSKMAVKDPGPTKVTKKWSHSSPHRDSPPKKQSLTAKTAPVPMAPRAPDHEALGLSSTEAPQGAEDPMRSHSRSSKTKPHSLEPREQKPQAQSSIMAPPAAPIQYDKSVALTALPLVPSLSLPALSLLVPHQFVSHANLLIASTLGTSLFGTIGTRARSRPSFITTPAGSAPPLSSDEEDEVETGVGTPS